MKARGYQLSEICGGCGQPVHHTHPVTCRSEFRRQLLRAFPQLSTREGYLTRQEIAHLRGIFAAWTQRIREERSPEYATRVLTYFRWRSAVRYVRAVLARRGIPLTDAPVVMGLPHTTAPISRPVPRTPATKRQKPTLHIVRNQPTPAHA